MTVKLVSDEQIAQTSSKGNQEKWFDREQNLWYKLDQFGYEALAETLISMLLEQSQLERKPPFSFVRYHMERLRVHGHERTGCSSPNFLEPGSALIPLHRLLTAYLGCPAQKKLMALSSDKRRIAYLAEMTAEITGLRDFPQYLTLLFEIDALFCNDDRHLNNIAVIERNGAYDYCPIFDQGAGLLSNTRLSPMDIMPKALLGALKARPFHMTFTRQMNTARGLYGRQLEIPIFSREEISGYVQPLLEYYPERDRGLIADRVEVCILTRQRYFHKA